jgi:hypothetical protein
MVAVVAVIIEVLFCNNVKARNLPICQRRHDKVPASRQSTRITVPSSLLVRADEVIE